VAELVELFVLALSLLDLSLLMLSLMLILSVYSGGGSAKTAEIGVWVGVSGLLLRVGVGEGVISVEGETSTSSASRYHLRRLV
jgi:hypothetical protein